MKQLLLFFLLLTTAVYPQSNRVFGKVIDAETKEALIGSYINLGDHLYQTSTDVNGEFIIDSIPPGTYIMQCSYLPYITSADTFNFNSSGESKYFEVALEKDTALLRYSKHYINNNYYEGNPVFRFSFYSNGKYLSSPSMFSIKADYVKNDSCFYTFQVDTLQLKNQNIYTHIRDEIVRNIQFTNEGRFEDESERKLRFYEKDLEIFEETYGRGYITIFINEVDLSSIFKTDSTYNLIWNRRTTRPSIHSLFISDAKDYIFVGVVEYNIEKLVFPKRFPISISSSKIMKDNYLEDWLSRFTNLELNYQCDNDSVLVKQGEIAKLKDWTIYQQRASIREGGITSSWHNQLSFIIVKNN